MDANFLHSPDDSRSNVHWHSIFIHLWAYNTFLMKLIAWKCVLISAVFWFDWEFGGESKFSRRNSWWTAIQNSFNEGNFISIYQRMETFFFSLTFFEGKKSLIHAFSNRIVVLKRERKEEKGLRNCTRIPRCLAGQSNKKGIHWKFKEFLISVSHHTEY